MVYQTPAKIVKGECRDKKKTKFSFLIYAEPHLIIYKESESRKRKS